jgi:protein-disulfide isomerase
MEEENKNIQQNPFLIPFSIIIAGVIVAAAIFYSFGGKQGSPTSAPSQQSAAVTPSSLGDVTPVSSSEHILGDINAPVKVVEYSDIECPFCKSFQATMNQVVDLYPGKVAWVYRHYPIDQLHSKARRESVATECAAKLGGNKIFWKYLDKIFEITPSNNGLDLNQLPLIAEQMDLDQKQFSQCLAGTEFDGLIQSQIDEAQNLGARGTPFSVVIASNGKKYEIDGAQPLAVVRQIIETALNSK